MLQKILYAIAVLYVYHILRQLLPKKKQQPPLVFHFFPWLGSTIEYGINPELFFRRCREKHGDVFTFVLLGRKTTACLGTSGNDFVLNAKHVDVNAEEIYRGLTEPVFGSGVCYAVPHHKMLEQKKFLKFGLTSDRLRTYVPLFIEQIEDYLQNSSFSTGASGIVNISSVMAEITIQTASRTLQGKEARENFDGPEFAALYHDLDMGFAPINFVAPNLPIPANRRRDAAQKRIATIFVDIIQRRRHSIESQYNSEADTDMIHNLMHSYYKDGTKPPDSEIAHMLVALLMAGQHSSASIGAWIMLRLASRSDIQEALFDEQLRLGKLDQHESGCVFPVDNLTYEIMTHSLPLHVAVVRETLRLHAPIHSIMRAVKNPLEVGGYCIPTDHVLLAAPGVTAQSSEHFPNPLQWEPRRWLTADLVDPSFLDMGKGASSPYLPFGAGRHRCIGETFAYLQLSTIVALLVRQFRWSYKAHRGVPMTDYTSLFSRPQDPSEVVWDRRTL